MKSTQLCHDLGVTQRQLQHWCNRGWLGDEYVAPGKGSHRRFDSDAIAVVVSAVRLINAGWTVARAFEVANQIKQKGTHEQAS